MTTPPQGSPGSIDPAAVPAFFDDKASQVIVASLRQQGNPLLQHIRNVPYEFSNIIPDYLVGKYAAVLFISLKYHRLYPMYIKARVASLQKNYKLRLLLCLVDLDEADGPLGEITLLAYQNNFTLFVVSSALEAARVLETFKAYEQKPADLIQSKLETQHSARVLDVLTAIPSVNRTDAVTLGKTFQTMEGIISADTKILQKCVGIGEKKAKQIIQTFNEPFFSD
ncbi:Dna repair protein rad10 subfamily protein [Cardiosporidium cionae]|uniref:Dna repair protein rad10 subfamily protein n=1 Tax=Cardiosporidium cionae TaxID=476202 RepID=A0ABQ7JAW7_9APIC|nr:Dna repair protein rad10 subfamily protein [Cardiosporidium cionae]|eukprot:KAF8821147.1 Dna repair protein rad10 subfamily protein [Cardiosporidium cionae]